MHFCCTQSVLQAPPIFVQCRVLITGAVLLPLLLWVLTCRTYGMLQRADHHHRHHRHHHATHAPPSPTVTVGKQLKAVAVNIFNLCFKFVSLGSSVTKAVHNALGDQHLMADRERCECRYSCSVRAADIARSAVSCCLY